jgi:hypothetical protein
VQVAQGVPGRLDLVHGKRVHGSAFIKLLHAVDDLAHGDHTMSLTVWQVQRDPERQVALPEVIKQLDLVQHLVAMVVPNMHLDQSRVASRRHFPGCVAVSLSDPADVLGIAQPIEPLQNFSNRLTRVAHRGSSIGLRQVTRPMTTSLVSFVGRSQSRRSGF